MTNMLTVVLWKASDGTLKSKSGKPYTPQQCQNFVVLALAWQDAEVVIDEELNLVFTQSPILAKSPGLPIMLYPYQQWPAAFEFDNVPIPVVPVIEIKPEFDHDCGLCAQDRQPVCYCDPFPELPADCSY